MGSLGSFSEEAAELYKEKFLKKQSTKIQLVPLVSAENVLTALEKGEVAIGIFPIENSNGGIVLEAVHAMSKHNFTIERMFDLEVKHCLLVKKGAKPSGITAVSSHDQALKQCRMYLKRTWPDVDIQVYADTALAAKDLSAGVLPPTTAVIAPKRCSKLYKLDVLEEGIQDLKFNYTVFIAATARK